MAARKFFYLFTCEYCFSHYVTIFMLFLTGYKLLMNDWRGYLIAGFALVWIANFYMSIFALMRQNIKLEKIKNELGEEILEQKKRE